MNCDNIVEGIETFSITLKSTNDSAKVKIGKNESVGRINDSTGMNYS